MFSKLIRIIILSFTLLEFLKIKLVKCGAIEVQDYSLDYTNAADMRQMKFIFRLQSGLGTNNYLRLSFPNQIYATAITTVVVQYSYQGTNGCSTMQVLPATIQLDSGSPTNYLISFQNDIGQPAALLASPNWYALYIYPEVGTTFASGMWAPIQARTQSINTVAAPYGTPIIYDFTNSFAVLEFDASVSLTNIATISISSLYTTVSTVIGQYYDLSFIVNPQQSIANGARIVFKINKDQNFQFIGMCVSEENVSSSGTTPPLDSSAYSCIIDSTNNRVIASIYAGVVLNTIYRFRVTIQNPNYVSIVTPDLEIRTMLSNSNKIIEKKIIYNALSVTPLTATKSVILGNGINLADATYPKKASVMSGQNFYNPFTFQFSPSIQTPDKVKLSVQFKLQITMATDYILPGSIQHNFPRYDSSTPVMCQLLEPSTNTYYYIQCDQVGPLSSTNTYFVTARVFFKNPGVLDTNFGSVQVFTVDPNTGATTTLIPMTAQVFASNVIRANLAVIDTSVATYGEQLVHSQPSQDGSGNQLSLSPISSNSAGIKVCNNSTQPYKLVFTLSTAAGGWFGAGTNQAFRLTTTPLIQAMPGVSGSQFYVESLNGGCTSSTAFPADSNRMITTYTTYTDILFAQTGGSTNCMTSGGTSTFSMGDVTILSLGSPYAGRDAFDFYGAFYSTYAGTSTTPSNYFAVNGNTYSMTGTGCTTTSLSYINIVLSNYQTSNSGAGQNQIADGSTYTAFIRVTGYLTSDEVYKAKRIAVFFDNLDFYPIGNDQYGQMQVSCSSSMNTNQQCWGYSGKQLSKLSMSSLSRVEFDVSAFIGQTGASSPFQLLIPVSAIASQNAVTLQVAVLINNPYFGQQTRAYQIYKTKPGYILKNGSQAAIYTPLSDLSYLLVVSTRTQGSIDDAQLNIGHALTVPTIIQNNPNVDNVNIGAAFVIVGTWKMYTDTLTVATTSVVNTNVMSEHCLAFSYYKNVQMYGIYCPFTFKDTTITINPTTFITFNNFLYPAQGPLKLAGTTISWSQNNGALIASLADSTAASQTLNANVISNVKSIVVPRYFKDNRIQWLFTTTNPIPKAGTITILLSDSGNPWGFSIYTGNLAKCILYSQVGSFSSTACTISISGISIVFTLSAASDFPAGSYNLVQYGFQAPSTSLSKTYAITITTASAAGSIDQSNSSSTLTFDNSVSWNTSIDNISFAYTHPLISSSVGNIDLMFRVNSRPILALSTPNPGAGLIAGQYLQIQISQLVGQEANMQCFVMQNGATYFGFSSIDSSSANQIRLFPRSDILTQSLTFQLRCLNVQNIYQASPTFSIALNFNNGAAQTMISGTLSPSGASNPAYSTPGALTGALLNKYNGLAGAKNHLSFKLTFSVTGITVSSSIFLQFPPKYDHKVGSSLLSCRVNNKIVYCFNYVERAIQITAFPVTIAAGTQFTLEVYGINAPLVAAGGGNIIVSVSTSNSPAQIKEQSSVADPVTLVDKTTSLYVISSTLSDTFCREQNQYQFNMKANSIINSGQYLYFEFPTEFGTSISVSPPTTCLILLTLTSPTIYGQGCTVFDSTILIPVTTNIPASNFIVQIQSIINPEDTLCNINRVMVSALSSDRTSVTGKTSAASSNQLLFRSTYNSNLRYLNWFQGSTEIMYNFATITLIVGSSTQIKLEDTTGAISRMITYSITPSTLTSGFQITGDNNNNYIYPGQLQENIMIGCPVTQIPGLYTLMFTKTELNTVATYGNIGLLNIIVSTAQNVISPAYTTYQVYAGGYSLPIEFDLSSMPPFEGVSIQFTIGTGGTTDPQISLLDENLSPVPQFTLNFSPTQTQGSILVRSAISMAATAQTWSVLQMNIFGTDASSYVATSTQIVLQLINVSPTPTLAYTQKIDQVSQAATSQTVSVSANLPCTVYYYIRTTNGPTRAFTEVQSLVQEYVQLNPMDYYQEQFGIFNYENAGLAGTAASFQISNLRSKMSYIITTWAMDQLLRLTSSTDFIFSTKNNNGRVMKIPIIFSKAITTAQKTKIACFMCETFAIPCLNIMSYDSVYCSNESAYQLTIVDTVNTGINRRLQNVETDQSSRMLQTTSSSSATVNFYSISIDQYEEDLTWNSIISIVSASTFSSLVTANDATLPSIVSISVPTEVSQFNAPVYESQPIISSGQTWFYVGNIQTNMNSLIWMYLVDASSGGTPSQQQMKFMLTSQNLTSSTFSIQYYNQVTPVSMNYTSLNPGTVYAVYYLATTENPSLFAPATNVYFVGNYTLNVTKTVKTFSLMISYFGFFSLIIFWMI